MMNDPEYGKAEQSGETGKVRCPPFVDFRNQLAFAINPLDPLFSKPFYILDSIFLLTYLTKKNGMPSQRHSYKNISVFCFRYYSISPWLICVNQSFQSVSCFFAERISDYKEAKA